MTRYAEYYLYKMSCHMSLSHRVSLSGRCIVVLVLEQVIMGLRGQALLCPA